MNKNNFYNPIPNLVDDVDMANMIDVSKPLPNSVFKENSRNIIEDPDAPALLTDISNKTYQIRRIRQDIANKDIPKTKAEYSRRFHIDAIRDLFQSSDFKNHMNAILNHCFREGYIGKELYKNIFKLYDGTIFANLNEQDNICLQERMQQFEIIPAFLFAIFEYAKANKILNRQYLKNLYEDYHMQKFIVRWTNMSIKFVNEENFKKKFHEFIKSIKKQYKITKHD